MSIRITGMFSGLDTESIISELVSAQSVKKNSLVKAQTKLSWKQDAWKALNTKIYNFYTNTLSDMRYQASYLKKVTKLSNTNAIKVITSDDAVDGVRSVKVNQLAKGGRLTGGSLATKDGVGFSGAATLSQLRKHRGEEIFGSGYESQSLSGSFRIVGAQGQYVDFNVNENTTIDDIVSMAQSVGLNANYDPDSQRIFMSSKKTGELNNFNLQANDAGGMNALACLGLLSKDDIVSSDPTKKTWTETWAGYKDASGANTAEYEKLIKDEIASRAEAYQDANKKLSDANTRLQDEIAKMKEENDKFFTDLSSSDFLGQEFAAKYPGEDLYTTFSNLYGDGGLYDKLQQAQKEYDDASKLDDSYDSYKNLKKAALEQAQKDYDDTKKKVDDFIQDVAYGPLEKVQKKDEDGNPVFEADGTTPVYEVKLDKDGNEMKDEDGNPIYVMERTGGVNKEYEDAVKAGGEIPADLKAKVDSVNQWFNAFGTAEENRKKIDLNQKQIDTNTAQIVDNAKYFTVNGEGKAEGTADLDTQVRSEFDTRVQTAKEMVDAVNSKPGMFTGSKVNAQDAEVEIDGAKFTSMDNTFSVNGLTLTAQEVTDKEITMTTSTDTDGIYNMIKNFFTEYNKLINEMDSLYNADASTGYEPLLSEEKEALSEGEIEEWEKKIKDSLLRRDSTLSSVSLSMTSILLQGAEVNGQKMYLSDFGINTLGYFKAEDNERNAYHIDGDPDDAATKANEDKLKSMIASDPETVMNFFTKLSTNLYDDLTKKMAGTTLSSAMTVYNDKQMQSEYKDYTSKIKKQEDKLNAMMDKWYKKFSQMEVAMSKLESRSSSLASILGG